MATSNPSTATAASASDPSSELEAKLASLHSMILVLAAEPSIVTDLRADLQSGYFQAMSDLADQARESLSLLQERARAMALLATAGGSQ